ncbi:hypothetical protein LTR48_000346 [Friedmanniomyces endolithicus]|uniref:F-box domain-containing protein n=1 Tax=Rachicladosporium monterosium TaxID=1507873 RepID=A0ABR0LI01_9PEZI|nr:hypothetical protein LTS16_024585 [Friedmanniomyces endolithicus]KAK1089586.1 hypothetical protein LTR48_000346 [Friedmanniomyces endolithicus]KAK5148543.1 hypothetical protein LTR32_000140 [Rachicladosporium monterosium]
MALAQHPGNMICSRGLQCETITTLNVWTSGYRAFEAFFEHIGQAMPNLHSLTAHNRDKMLYQGDINATKLASLTKLEHLDLRIGVRYMGFLAFPPSLATLQLATPAQFCAATDPTWHLPKLTKLCMDMPNATDSSQVLAMFLSSSVVALEEMSQLDTFELRGAALQYHCFATLFTHYRLQGLCHLSLRGNRTEWNLWDIRFCQLVVWLPQLQTIDLSCTAVGPENIQHLLNLPHLERIVTNDCRRIEEDTVTWARKRGINVQACNSEEDQDQSDVDNFLRNVVWECEECNINEGGCKHDLGTRLEHRCAPERGRKQEDHLGEVCGAQVTLGTKSSGKEAA